MQERADRWAATMQGAARGSGIRLAHADSHAAAGARSRRTVRQELEHELLAATAHPRRRRRRSRPPRGARRVAHVLRARPRPHPARPRLPPPRRQDPGLRVPRRPPADAAHARPRGRPGGHVGGPRPRPQRRPHRGHRPRPRLRPRPRRPRQRGRPVAVRRRRLRPRRVGRRRHAGAAEPVRRDARRHPQPLVEPPGAARRRRARSSRGPTASPTCATTSRTPSRPASSPPTCCPTASRARCGDRPVAPARRRSSAAMVDAAAESGRVGMTEPLADALADFRRFNYEHVYLRPASRAQADAVIALLRALVEHYGDRPHLLPDPPAGSRRHRRRRPRRRVLRGRHDRPLRLPPGRVAARLGPRQAPPGRA